MKIFAFSIFFFAFLTSCSDKGEKTTEAVLEPAVPKISGNKNLPGHSLINASDCLSCHKDNAPFVGPSYQEIAKKYSEKDVDLLASKIIEGGSGVWGEVPMQPHPQISKDEAKQMVAYILSVK